VPISTPSRRSDSGFSARAESGHATAAPPRSEMKSRRLMGFVLRLRTPAYHTIECEMCCFALQQKAPLDFRYGSRVDGALARTF
jgi:hypothetical protein